MKVKVSIPTVRSFEVVRGSVEKIFQQAADNVRFIGATSFAGMNGVVEVMYWMQTLPACLELIKIDLIMLYPELIITWTPNSS